MITKEMYDDYIKKLKTCLEIYENRRMNYMIINYKTSSDIDLNYTMMPKHIAHLLGVNTPTLSKICCGGGVTSYNLLKYLIHHSEYVWNKLSKDGKYLEKKVLFSPYVDEKLKSFIPNLNHNPNELEVVIELDSEKTFLSEYDNELIQLDYILLRNYQDDYCLLGLKKDSENKLVPITNMLIPKEKIADYAKYFYKQNTYYIETAVLYDRESKNVVSKIWPDLLQKKYAIKKLQDFKYKYHTSICVDRSYENSLQNIQNNFNRLNELRNGLTNLSEMIKLNIPINRETFKVDELSEEVMSSLIETINDKLFIGFRKNSKPYSELKKELLEEKRKREVADRQNLKLRTQVETMNGELDELKRELKIKRKTMNQIAALLSNQEE